MSFGGPGGRQASFKPSPPERGSFPLDHDGDCKPIIADYLRCLKHVGGQNDQKCRLMAKEYLKCRMEHNLMAPDKMKNLGFEEEKNGGKEKVNTGGEGGVKVVMPETVRTKPA